MVETIWAMWDGAHDSEDQKKRISKAYLADNTPLSVSAEDFTGKFQGSHGRYDVALSECTCTDFKRRKQPCKHMYRLAIELGLFGDKSKARNDQYARKVPKDELSELSLSVVGRIENYIDEEQIKIKEILLDALYHEKKIFYFEDASCIQNALNDGILDGKRCYHRYFHKLRKKDILSAVESQGDVLPKDCKLVKDMVCWLIANSEKYGPLLFPNCMEVELGLDLSLVSLTVYKYLHRKFDERARLVSVLDETNTEVWVEKEFPDDLATGLLNMFGTNPFDK